MINHKKTCSCPDGFSGEADVECYRVPGACRHNRDCKTGFKCESGVCAPVCFGDTNCAQNEKCVTGMCLCKYSIMIN